MFCRAGKKEKGLFSGSEDEGGRAGVITVWDDGVDGLEAERIYKSQGGPDQH